MSATYLQMLTSCVPDGTRISVGFYPTEAMSLTGQMAVRGGSGCCCDANMFTGCVPDGTRISFGFYPTETMSLTGQLAVRDGSGCCDVANMFTSCVPDGTRISFGFYPTEAMSLTGQMTHVDNPRPRRGQGSVTKKCNKCVGAYFCHAVSKNCDNA